MTGVLAHHRCASDLVCTAHHCFYSVNSIFNRGKNYLHVPCVINVYIENIRTTYAQYVLPPFDLLLVLQSLLAFPENVNSDAS